MTQRTQGQGSLLQMVFQSLVLAHLPTHSCTQLPTHSSSQPLIPPPILLSTHILPMSPPIHTPTQQSTLILSHSYSSCSSHIHSLVHSFPLPSILLSFHPSTHPPIHLPEITAGVPRPGRAFPRLTTSTPGLRQAKLSPDCLFVPVFLLNHLRGLVGVCGKKQPPPRTCEADGWGPGGGCEGSALQAV